MIKVISGGVLILGSLLTPAQAGQILPYLYAREYCSLREMGVSKVDARAAALSEAYVHSLPDKPKVTLDGNPVSPDVISAVRVVSETCPQHL